MSKAVTSGHRVLVGGLSVAGARMGSHLVQVLVFILGARVLGPRDFGVFALLSAGAMFAAVLGKAGCGGYILSSRAPRQCVREALTIANLLGFAVAALGVIAAGIMLFLTPLAEVAPLVALFSIWVQLAASSDAQLAILVRDGRLIAAAACDLAGEIAGAIVAIAMLSAGFGAAALVWGRISAQGLQFVGALILSKTPPTITVSRFVFKELTEFSKNVLSVRLLGNLRMTLATFVIGASIGAASVGFFRVAQRLTGALYELLSEPARSVGWVLFRGVGQPHEDINSPEARSDFQRTMEWIVPLLFAISGPVFLGVAIMSYEILAAMLGEEWRPAAPLVSILAIASLILVPAALTEPLLGLTGKMSLLPRVSLFNTVVALALIVSAAQFNIVMVAWAQLASGVVAFATTIYLHKRSIGLSWGGIFMKSVFLVPILFCMTVLAIIVRNGASDYGLAPIFSLVVTAVPAAVLYFGGIALLQPKIIPRFRKSLRNA